MQLENSDMIRVIFAGFVFCTLPIFAGCGTPGQYAANNDEWFRKNNEDFDRRHAEFITRGAQSVRDYQQYMNRQP